MRRKLLHGMVTGCLATVGVLVAGANAQTQDDKAPPKTPAVNAKTLWPVGLEALAGRYVFLQVATPGGMWERGGNTPRQIALPDCPKELQDLLMKAEIVISDIAKPTEITADERLSPSKRGNLRFYHEEGSGKLTLKNLPGIGGADGDKGQYSGPADFALDHQSHSNPSAFGIMEQRKRQEPTWGAAALDFADLNAFAPDVPGKDNEAPIMGNARILKSGVEIFAFIEWDGKGPRGMRNYMGCVRLGKKGADVPPAKPNRDLDAKEVALAR
jgi:hypothetical protein